MKVLFTKGKCSTNLKKKLPFLIKSEDEANCHPRNMLTSNPGLRTYSVPPIVVSSPL